MPRVQSCIIAAVEGNLKKPDFPILMQQVCGPSAGTIVLFYSEHSGTVVYVPDGKRDGIHILGRECTTWDIEAFTPFNGKIILSNIGG